MKRSKWIYYVGFPVATFGLCLFAYYLGWQRGKQWREVSSSQKPVESLLKEHESAQELTFFKTLKDEPSVKPIEDAEPAKTPSPTKVVSTPAPKALLATEPAAVTAAPKNKKGYVIQISAFRDIGKAHELADQIKNDGYPAFTKTTKEMGGALHRVYVGTYDEKGRAVAVVAELKKKGFKEGFVTSVGGK